MCVWSCIDHLFIIVQNCYHRKGFDNTELHCGERARTFILSPKGDEYWHSCSSDVQVRAPLTSETVEQIPKSQIQILKKKVMYLEYITNSLYIFETGVCSSLQGAEMQSPAKLTQLPRVSSIFSLELSLVSVDPLQPRQLLCRDVHHSSLCSAGDCFGRVAEFLWNLFWHIPAPSSWLLSKTV